MKIALDIHGVIDTNPKSFSELTTTLYFDEKTLNEIHVLTGSRLGDGKIKKELKDMNIFYTHIFSIADYMNMENYPELPQSTPEDPWFCKEDWDKVKADYCRRHKIDLCLDDCDAYFQHFTTPIARFYSKDK